MTKRYDKSKANKYKVTQSDIDNDNNKSTISPDTVSDTTSCNNINYMDLNIVKYTLNSEMSYIGLSLNDDMILCLSQLSNNKRVTASDIDIALWRQENKLFNDCVDNIIKAKVTGDERRMIMKDDKSDNMVFFQTKKWFPEYRDNAIQSIDKAVIINVRLDNADNIAKMVTDVTEQAKEMIDDHNNSDT